MSEIKELTNEIVVSLYFEGATIDELMKRDFLKNKSKFGVGILIKHAKNDGFIYETKTGKLKAYKHIKNILRFSEYEL